MQRTMAVVVAAVLFESSALAQEPVSVATMPPVVVKTVPQSGDVGVSPSTKEIQVTFSKPMQDGSWSWSQISSETFPKTAGKPHYRDDERTCVLPVKLEPGRTYVIWVNSAKFTGFGDQEGRPAVPYLLVFQTRGGGAGRSPR